MYIHSDLLKWSCYITVTVNILHFNIAVRILILYEKFQHLFKFLEYNYVSFFTFSFFLKKKQFLMIQSCVAMGKIFFTDR